MNEKPAPAHLLKYVEEMVEVGVQLATMLDHMYRHPSPHDPAKPPPPEILRDLVAKTLEPRFGARKREIQRATDILSRTNTTISDEIYLVEPGAFDDLTEDDFEDSGLDDLDDDGAEDPFNVNGSHLH